MSRPPQYDISLDNLSAPTSLRDFQRADAAIVRLAEAQQHALMSGWGTPATAMTFASIPWSTSPTGKFFLRVPPFCRKFRVVALMAGFSDFTLRVGSLEAVAFVTHDIVETIYEENWVEGSPPITQPANSGFLEVLASASASWQTVVVDFAWSSNVSYALGQWVSSLAFYPILEQAV